MWESPLVAILQWGRLWREMSLGVEEVLKKKILTIKWLIMLFIYIVPFFLYKLWHHRWLQKWYSYQPISQTLQLFFPFSLDNITKLVMVYQHIQIIFAVENLYPGFLSTLVKSGVNELWFMSQIWPIISFCVACDLRIYLSFICRYKA